MSQSNNLTDCLPEPIIKHQTVDDLCIQWYETVSPQDKPHGYYFYTFDEKWCYGPYLTKEQAESGFNRWVEGRLP
jgi:hypothetical protein